MKYRLRCLTPVLVGDGSALSPVDYMVWKDQVNVLDQRRIFKLLSRGPRLDNYLLQIRRAEKLEFSAWGGFAQNFAGRRIPFEDPSSSAYWNRLRAEQLHIPTFASSLEGPYLPASALRGALRTTVLASRATEKSLKPLADSMQADRGFRDAGSAWEHQFLGRPSADLLRAFSIADSSAAAASSFKIYLLRTAVLAQGPSGSDQRFSLAWKQSPRGSVDARRVDESTPVFAEMAAPGTVFEGTWTENDFFRRPEIAQALRWHRPLDVPGILAAANGFAAQVLDLHRTFAETARLETVRQSVQSLLDLTEQARQSGDSCVLTIGWGGGFLSKSAWPRTEEENYRRILASLPYYARAIRSGLPFPKTRRVVFMGNQPAALPGWALLEIR